MLRRHVLLLAVLPAVLQAAAAPAQQRIRVHVNLNARVNAVYHVACLAESIGCTREVFDRFWKSQLSWSEADQSALDTWRSVMTDVSAAAPPRPPAPLLPNTPRFHPAQAARTSVIVAVLEASSVADLYAKLQGILSQEDATELHRIVDHFEQRLNGWFKTAAGADVQLRVRQAVQHVRDIRFSNTVEKMAAFLQAELPAPDLYVDAIVGPEPRSEDFAATQLGPHLLVEVVNVTTSGGIVSGAVHELTHYIYDRAPVDKHRALITQFVQSGSPHAPGLYTYLNEAVAVAAQAVYGPAPSFATINPQTKSVVVFEKTRDDGYRHPYVAPLGAAAVPLVRDAISRKGTLFDGFAARYITAGTARLNEKVIEPQFALAQVGLRLPDRGDSIRATWLEVMFPHASAQFADDQEADAFPDLPIARFVRYEDIQDSGVKLPDLSSLVRHRAFVYAMPRGQRTTTYVVAGRDTDAITDAIRKLATLSTLPSKGLVLSVD